MRFNIPLDLDKIVLFKYEDPIKTSKTVGDKIQVSLKRKRKANKLRFLMILQDVDFKRCIYSKYDIIMYNKTNFPGMLTIERFDESNNFPYTIQGPAMPRQLYIMLPKECIYVTSNNFTEKLIRSKLRELMDIFIVLQAKKIKFFYSDSQKSSSNIGVEIGSLHPNISSTIDNRIDNEETKQYGFLYEMHFEKPTAPIDLKKFLEPYYYYLPDHLRKRLWGGKFLGQKQKWFLFNFEGKDEEVNLNVHKKPEFYKWKWVEPRDACAIIVNFKKKIYMDILKEFKFIDS